MKRLAVKRLLAALCALMLLAGTGLMAAPRAEASSYFVEDACNGCVRIIAETYFGGLDAGDYRYGTGFFIGVEGEPVQYLVTNWHVVAQYSDAGISEPPYVYVAFNNDLMHVSRLAQIAEKYTMSDRSMEPDCMYAFVMYYSEQADLAILMLDQPTTQRKALKLMSGEYVNRTDTVYAIGFPSISDFVVSSEELASGIKDMTVTKGTVTKTENVINERYYMQTDVSVNPGNSGGPLVTEEGYVVGINTLSSYSQLTNYSLWSDYVMAALDRPLIEYMSVDRYGNYLTGAPEPVGGETAATASNTEEEFDKAFGGGAFIGIAIGAVVLVVGLILRGVIKKKKRESEPPAGGSVGPAARYTEGGKPAAMSSKPSFSVAPPAPSAPPKASAAYTPPVYTPPAPTPATGGFKSGGSFAAPGGGSKPPAHTPAAPAPASGGLRSSSSFAAPKSGTGSAAPFAGASGPKPTEEEAYFKKNSGF